MLRRCVAVLLLLFPGLLVAQQLDPRSGLVVAPGWELVLAHCGACHSHQLVTAQRGDAAFWEQTIVWMQRTQNLWQIPADQRAAIIAYLAGNYNETDWGRRPPLSPRLLPPPADY
jgi:mono/diheme cytochrome c family protein